MTSNGTLKSEIGDIFFFMKIFSFWLKTGTRSGFQGLRPLKSNSSWKMTSNDGVKSEIGAILYFLWFFIIFDIFFMFFFGFS